MVQLSRDLVYLLEIINRTQIAKSWIRKPRFKSRFYCLLAVWSCSYWASISWSLVKYKINFDYFLRQMWRSNEIIYACGEQTAEHETNMRDFFSREQWGSLWGLLQYFPTFLAKKFLRSHLNSFSSSFSQLGPNLSVGTSPNSWFRDPSIWRVSKRTVGTINRTIWNR